MQVDYDPFVDRMIRKYEGPYGWNKHDPGGPTKYGITCYDLAADRGQKMDSMARWAPVVQAMTLATAEDIYATKYAKAINFDALPAGPDVVMMDYAVNSGVGRGKMILKEFNGDLEDPVGFINKVCDERLRFMRGLKTWPTFGRGWNARVVDLRAYALALHSKEPVPEAPDLSQVVTPKAVHVPTTAGSLTTGAVVTSGAAAYHAGLPIWGVAGVTVAVIAAGIVYEAISEQSANAANLKVA